MPIDLVSSGRFNSWPEPTAQNGAGTGSCCVCLRGHLDELVERKCSRADMDAFTWQGYAAHQFFGAFCHFVRRSTLDHREIRASSTACIQESTAVQ